MVRCSAFKDMSGISRVELATGFLSRMRGLLNPVVCARGEVLLLAPCACIHTFGMSEAIDVAFVNQQGCVIKTMRGLAPNRLVSCKDSVCVLERRSGSSDVWFELGESLGLSIQPRKG
jgi:uncharacterized membrane protein (UPF0127 family)